MAQPKFEFLGTGDGVTTVFTTANPYSVDSIALWVRALVREKTNDDGFFETDPVLGTITLKIAPEEGDVVHALYFDTSEAPLVIVRDELDGELDTVVELDGEIEDSTLFGEIDTIFELDGEIDGAINLDGEVETIPELSGDLECP